MGKTLFFGHFCAQIEASLHDLCTYVLARKEIERETKREIATQRELVMAQKG